MKEYKDLTEAFSEFKKNAIEHGQHTMSGDHKLCNKCYKNIMNAVKYIASKGKYDGYKPMLEDSNSSVRIWAASALLHVDTKNAVKALKKVIKEDDGVMGVDAEMILEEFKNGNLKKNGEHQNV